MTSEEYLRLKLSYILFCQKVLTEFMLQYDKQVPLNIPTSKSEEEIIASATKCFILYLRQQ